MEKYINFFNKHQKYIYIGIGVFMLVVAFVLYYFVLEKESIEQSVEENKIVQEEVKEEIEYYYVDIKGAINNPGVYKLEVDKRVSDVIEIAGGFKENAAVRYINLSKKITDEMTIIIYTDDEIKKLQKDNVQIVELPCLCPEVKNDACITNENNSENNSTSSKVSINTATKEQLMTLNGIGESKADAIIDYRKQKGSFTSIEDIKKVSGIGDAIYSKIKDYITL